MTFDVFLRVLLRRWYVLLLGLLITGFFAQRTTVSEPLYWTRAEILFVEPDIPPGEAYLQIAAERLVPFVAAVETSVNGDSARDRLNSTEATLFGTGVRHGHKLEMPNEGSQWVLSFPRPVLTLEAVGETPKQVMTSYRTVLTEVEATAERLQAEQGVPRRSRIQVVPETREPAVAFVGATRQAQARALVATVGVGLTLSVLAALGIDHWLGRRRHGGPAAGVGGRGANTGSLRAPIA